MTYQTIEEPGGVPTVSGYVPCAEEDDVAQHLLRPCFAVEVETVLVAGFDNIGRLLCLEQAEEDRRGRCTIPAAVWRAAIDAGPTRIVLAHNHPSGIARPSDADLAMTRESARMLRLVGIGLSDHLIFTADGHFSFRRAGLI